MKNGFTLVEVIGVVVILAIIGLLVMPSVIDMIKNTEEKNYEVFLKDMEIAAEGYIETSDFITFKNPGDEIEIPISVLISDGFVNENTENPKTKEKINIGDKIKIVLEENYTRTYTYILSGE